MTHSGRSSLADPFKVRDSLRLSSGERSSTYECDWGGRTSSRRESINTQFNDQLIAEWFDSNELTAAVCSSPSMSYNGQLLIQTNTAEGTSGMEVEEISNSIMKMEDRHMRNMQNNYTLESWRFRT